MAAPQTAFPMSVSRTTNRRMLPSSYKFQGKYALTNSWPLSPFRVMTNAGDLLLRSSAPSPISELGARRLRWDMRDGPHSGDGGSGNQKYVYDSSFYSKVKGLNAVLKKDMKYTVDGVLLPLQGPPAINNGAYVAKMHRY